jgi:hypothetical protein
MAVTTVSSLTESFQSGASVLQEDAVVGKETDHQDELSDIPENSARFAVQESKLLHAETSKLDVMDVVEG